MQMSNQKMLSIFMTDFEENLRYRENYKESEYARNKYQFRLEAITNLAAKLGLFIDMEDDDFTKLLDKVYGEDNAAK